MEEETTLNENNGLDKANSPTLSSTKTIKPLQNCSTQTTFVQQQQSMLNFSSSTSRATVAQPQTTPLTLPSNDKNGEFDASASSSMLSSENETSFIPNRTHLNVSQMVRQQSDTTNNRRLMRSTAICDDRSVTSNSSDSSHMPILTPFLKNPTRIVTMVDQETNESYMQLNQYRLMEEIGQHGACAVVRLAYNDKDQNLYAMKVLDKIKLVKNFACFQPPPCRKNRPVPTTHRNPLQLVQREIAILKKLRHPNVVKLVEVLDDPNDNYLYMVFEYVERRSLLELPTTNPLNEETAWKYFRDTLKGLEYLHFQKIVHRDLKPSNLLLSETDCVKIADFGVSCEFEGIDAFLTGTAGTPAFMAPEALTEDSSLFYSGRAQDIWSLGITLYALVYGRPPFWDTYIIALHRKIKNDPVHFPETPQISKPLIELVLGILKKDPGHRLMLHEIKQNQWVTRNGQNPMPTEEENCHLVTVTEEEIKNSVRVIPRLDTLILVKAMGHRKRFGNPFRTNTKSSTSIRLKRKSSSVRESSYITAFDGEIAETSGSSLNLIPDRPSSDQSDDVLNAMESISIRSPTEGTENHW